MLGLVEELRKRFRSVVPRKKAGAEILGLLSIFMLVGVTITGIWQFFAHEPNPDWFAYVPDTGFTAEAVPSTGMARIHGFFADGSVIVAMAGGGWFAYNIAHTIPKTAVVAFVTTVIGVFSGSLIRYNVVKIDGLRHEDATDGYWQLFVKPVEYVVTGRTEFGANGFRLLTVIHVATIPILVGFAWVAIRRGIAIQEEARRNSPARSWMRNNS